MQHGLPEQAIETTASRAGANKLGYRAVKRAFDLTTTAMAVIVLSPLFLILSVIVYLGDPCHLRAGAYRQEWQAVQNVEVQEHVPQC